MHHQDQSRGILMELRIVEIILALVVGFIAGANASLYMVGKALDWEKEMHDETS